MIPSTLDARATDPASRRSAVRIVLAVGAVGAAALLAIAELSTVFEVVVGSLQTVQRTRSGGDNHAYALLVVAIAAVVMALGAARGARPPAAALAALGIVALAVALAVDLPDTRASGRLPESITFEDADVRAGTGFYLETVGGALLLITGGLLLALGRPGAKA